MSKNKKIKIKELPPKIKELGKISKNHKDNSGLEENIRESDIQNFSEFTTSASEDDIAPVIRRNPIATQEKELPATAIERKQGSEESFEAGRTLGYATSGSQRKNPYVINLENSEEGTSSTTLPESRAQVQSNFIQERGATLHAKEVERERFQKDSSEKDYTSAETSKKRRYPWEI